MAPNETEVVLCRPRRGLLIVPIAVAVGVFAVAEDWAGYDNLERLAIGFCGVTAVVMLLQCGWPEPAIRATVAGLEVGWFAQWGWPRLGVHVPQADVHSIVVKPMAWGRSGATSWTVVIKRFAGYQVRVSCKSEHDGLEFVEAARRVLDVPVRP